MRLVAQGRESALERSRAAQTSGESILQRSLVNRPHLSEHGASVVATVHAPPAPPAELAGSWARTVDTSSLHNPPGIENPSGTYTLIFDPRWICAHFPGKFVARGPNASVSNGHGWIIDAYGVYDGQTITIAGAVNTHVLHDIDQQGGFWCGPNNRAVYRGTVGGDTLTLSAIGADRCAGRKLIWSGHWTRR